ncbi:MAG: winged helix-turn-helix transcriptional regulator [Halarchaeum sp.]
MSDDALELESRRDIYASVRDAPGVHVRELERRHDYAKGTLQYHLRELERAGLVEAHDDGKFTRYYASEDAFDGADRAVLSALRRQNSRRVLAHLFADGALSTSALADRLDRSPSTVSWHLSRLTDAGVVERERDGRAVLYSLRDPERVERLYTTYRRGLTDRLIDGLLDVWDGY